LWQFSPFFVAVLAVAIAETRSRTSPIALTQVRQRTPFGEKKSLKMPHRGPILAIFVCRRAP